MSIFLGFLVFVCIIVGGIFLLLLVFNLVRRKPVKKPIIMILLCFSGIVVLTVAGMTFFPAPMTEKQAVTETPATEIAELESNIEMTTIEAPTTSTPETTAVPETTTPVTTESGDDFIASCQKIGYKSLLRTPDDYIGQRLVITAKVQQVMEGGLFDSSKYYRVQTDNDGYEAYYDDEYFMYDFRTSDTTKLLKDDVLKIYAEFVGLEEVRRALTGTTEEVPAIKAYYVELISE